MRSDLLSKRMFMGGMFGLPWLWVVHVLYFRGNKESEEGLMNPDDRTYKLLLAKFRVSLPLE